VANNLLTQELLSDEASGPEDENEESLAAWKVRMAAAAGHTDLTPAALKNKDFVEVLECPWRSDQVFLACRTSILANMRLVQLSFISSSMQSLYRDAVNARRAGNIKYIRVPTPTHRKSSRIPRISPWDFGISSQWLDEQRSNPEVDVDGLLTDWGTHGNPEGWTDIPMTATATGARIIVDPRFDFEGLAVSETGLN
jgi:hypothetical protein